MDISGSFLTPKTSQSQNNNVASVAADSKFKLQADTIRTAGRGTSTETYAQPSPSSTPTYILTPNTTSQRHQTQNNTNEDLVCGSLTNEDFVCGSLTNEDLVCGSLPTDSIFNFEADSIPTVRHRTVSETAEPSSSRFLGSIFSGNSIKTQQGAIQPESSLVQTEENAASHPLSSTFSQFSFLKKSTHEFVHDGNTAVASNMDSNMMNEKFLSAKKSEPNMFSSGVSARNRSLSSNIMQGISQNQKFNFTPKKF